MVSDPERLCIVQGHTAAIDGPLTAVDTTVAACVVRPGVTQDISTHPRTSAVTRATHRDSEGTARSPRSPSGCPESLAREDEVRVVPYHFSVQIPQSLPRESVVPSDIRERVTRHHGVDRRISLRRRSYRVI